VLDPAILTDDESVIEQAVAGLDEEAKSLLEETFRSLLREGDVADKRFCLEMIASNERELARQRAVRNYETVIRESEELNFLLTPIKIPSTPDFLLSLDDAIAEAAALDARRTIEAAAAVERATKNAELERERQEFTQRLGNRLEQLRGLDPNLVAVLETQLEPEADKVDRRKLKKAIESATGRLGFLALQRGDIEERRKRFRQAHPEVIAELFGDRKRILFTPVTQATTAEDIDVLRQVMDDVEYKSTLRREVAELEEARDNTREQFPFGVLGITPESFYDYLWNRNLWEAVEWLSGENSWSHTRSKLFIESSLAGRAKEWLEEQNQAVEEKLQPVLTMVKRVRREIIEALGDERRLEALDEDSFYEMVLNRPLDFIRREVFEKGYRLQSVIDNTIKGLSTATEKVPDVVERTERKLAQSQRTFVSQDVRSGNKRRGKTDGQKERDAQAAAKRAALPTRAKENPHGGKSRKRK
jgi:hypothetical protein